ncbi:RluA family pseudouridine synthase [Roseicyclus sp. F158]|uniref:RluA family pseudouridine synthase n=1 Tax=Tropicimonas omnivorans TaxID=3075590 RepID=A0ABU3DCG5_9RHOB|nr:RluA family pseudouridine synthase [Roseicyclus sp. F158]MDT0681360.1 RluA family pseudouridine synthase [Roseicyclus sp. F158]
MRIAPPGGGSYAPPHGPIHILHDDAALLAVSKPPGLLSVPGKTPDLEDCLLSRLFALRPRTLIVHRLDRDTSGVMVFARTPSAQRDLSAQFEGRSVSKTYLAVTSAPPAHRSGIIDRPMRSDWPNRPKQMVHPEGRRAVTRFRTLGTSGGGTLLALRPETGRTHQLRVHLAAIGCPIDGDPLYGGAAAPRLMLHAWRLRLTHPVTKERLCLTAPWGPGFAQSG